MENFLAYLDEVWLVLVVGFTVIFLLTFFGISWTFTGGVFARLKKSFLMAILVMAILSVGVYSTEFWESCQQPEYKEYSLENFQGTSRSMVLSPFKEALNWDYKAKLFYNDRYVIICRQAKNDFKLAIKKIPRGFKTSKLDQALIVMKKDDF